MSRAKIKALLLAALMGSTACAGLGGRPASPGARPAGVDPGAAFMQGRMLELEGRLADAAEAYERAAAVDPGSAQLQRYLAQVRARMGDPERALEHARRAFELEPEDEATRRALAALFITTKRYAEAVALLEPVFESGELSDEGLFGLFNLYLAVEEVEKAHRVADRMIARDPSNLRGYLALGAAFERSKRPDEAEKVYRQALEIDPAHPAIYEALARLHRRANDPAGELAVLDEKLEAIPGDPQALQRKAQILDEQGEREAAIRVLETLTRLQPDHVGALFQLGYFYLQESRYEEASTRFTRAIDLASGDPDSPLLHELRYFLGAVRYESGHEDQALEVLAQVARSSERFSDARLLRARILEGREDYPHALAEARLAAEADPDNRELEVYLSGVLERSGDYEGAVARMKRLVARHPDDADLYYDLGLIHGEAGHEETALAAMNQALERNPDHASALNYVGYTWAEQGVNLDRAEEMIRHALELRPDDGYITDSLGWVLYRRGLNLLDAGEEEAARESLAQALEQLQHASALAKPEDPIIARHLGDVYRSMSRFHDALVAYRRALDLEPEEKDAVEIRHAIELLELEHEGASPGARN